MLSNILEIRVLDTGEQLPITAVQSFRILSSIHTSYPIGEIILDDTEGRVLSMLMLRPGSTIQIIAMSTDVATEGEMYFFAPMIIVGIENIDQNEVQVIHERTGAAPRASSLGGSIRIHLAHYWGIYTNWRNMGYSNKTISDVVNSLIKDKTRGFEFTETDIGETDDSADGPNRYKLQESETAFIAKKLLPYATIDNSAVYSFVNERHEFFFQSFKYLYDQDSTISIVPNIQEIGSLPNAEDVMKLKNKHDIVDGKWFIGRDFKQQLSAIKKFMFIDDSESRLSYRILSRHLSALPGYTLLRKGFVESAVALGSDVHPFRSFPEAARLGLNKASIMNQFFEINVTTTMCNDVAAVGYPAELRLATSQSDKTHWANGKWLVTETEHGLIEGTTYSKLLLSRPAIDQLPDEINAEEYYRVE